MKQSQSKKERVISTMIQPLKADFTVAKKQQTVFLQDRGIQLLIRYVSEIQASELYILF